MRRFVLAVCGPLAVVDQIKPHNMVAKRTETCLSAESEEEYTASNLKL